MNKSFKKIFKSDLSYHKNILITFFAISFLISLPFVKSIADNGLGVFAKSFRYNRIIGYPTSELNSYIPASITPTLFFLTILMAIFVFFAPLILFDFFHGKEKIDFYHSLPVKRKNLFLSKYFTGLLFIIVPYFLVSSILILLAHFFLDKPEGANLVFIFTIKACIMGTLLYTFSSFFSCVTTNKLSQFLATSISIISPMILIFFLAKLTSVGINQALLSPSYVFDFFSFVSLSNELNLYTFSVVKAIIVVILTLGILYLSLNIYKNFNSEDSYKNFTSKGFESFLSLCISFSASLLLIVFYVSVSNMYYTRNNYNLIVWGLFIVFILCFFILYYLFTAFFEKNASLNIFNFKNVSIIILSSCMLFSFTLFDTFNIKSRFPNPEKVKYASFNGYAFSEKENILLLEEISRSMANNATSMLYSDYATSSSAFFEYVKNNKIIYRSYDYKTDSEILTTIVELFDSPEYKEDYIQNLNLLKSYNLSLSVYADLNPSIYGNSKNNGRYYFSYSNAKELIDALILDIKQDENFSPYRMQNVNICNLGFSTYDTPHYELEETNKMFIESSVGYDLNHLPPVSIKPTYTNTINILKENFGEDYFDLLEDTNFISVKRQSVQDEKDLYLSENRHFLNAYAVSDGKYNLLGAFSNNDISVTDDFITFLETQDDVLSVDVLNTTSNKEEAQAFILNTQFFYSNTNGFSTYITTPIYEDMDVYELYTLNGDSDPTFFGTYLKPKNN